MSKERKEHGNRHTGYTGLLAYPSPLELLPVRARASEVEGRGIKRGHLSEHRAEELAK